MRKRTTLAASSASEGSVSNSNSTTRTAASGTIVITSWERPATLPSVSSTTFLTAPRWRKLPSTRSGTTVPGASSCAAQASRLRPSSASLPTSTRSAAISQASLGFAVLELELISKVNSLIQTRRDAKCNSWKGSKQWSVVSDQCPVSGSQRTSH